MAKKKAPKAKKPTKTAAAKKLGKAKPPTAKAKPAKTPPAAKAQKPPKASKSAARDKAADAQTPATAANAVLPEKAPKGASGAKSSGAGPAKTAAATKVAGAGAKGGAKAAKPAKAGKGSQRSSDALKREAGVFVGPPPDKALPRATKLPGPQEMLNKRDMEQVLTAGAGRGVGGEGSLKGRLVLHQGFPYLEVIGRDKRELYFLLQGPDQEVLPAYQDHRVSVSGLIRRTNNHGGTVDVRKYSAKKPDIEPVVVPVVAEEKLRFLSPGEVDQMSNAGMGAGMKGFASIRGVLELTGEDFFLVVSNAGTRHQVSFALEGKGTKGLKKFVGETMVVTGVVEKTAGFGGRIETESAEPRPTEGRFSRDSMPLTTHEGKGDFGAVEVKVNTALLVRLPEKAGFIWAVEPTMAKRVSLREANFAVKAGNHLREFVFTPRVPGAHELEFFLAKAFNPLQVQKSWKLSVTVKPQEPVLS